jgi:hypothetical protein
LERWDAGRVHTAKLPRRGAALTARFQIRTVPNISNKPVRIRGAFVGAVEGHTPNYWSMHTAAIAAASAHAQGHVPEGLQVPDADGVAQIIEHVHETMLGTDQGPPPDPPDPST